MHCRRPLGVVASPSVSRRRHLCGYASEWMPAIDVSHELEISLTIQAITYTGKWTAQQMCGSVRRHQQESGKLGQNCSFTQNLIFDFYEFSTNILAHKLSKSVNSCQLNLSAVTTTEMQRGESAKAEKLRSVRRTSCSGGNSGCSLPPRDWCRSPKVRPTQDDREARKVHIASSVCVLRGFLLRMESKVGRRLLLDYAPFSQRECQTTRVNLKLKSDRGDSMN